MRLDINYKKKSVKNTNTWRLNNTFLNNKQVIKEIKREIKKILETNDNETQQLKTPVGCSKSSSKREVYSNTILPQETRETLNRQPNLDLKQLEKEEQKPPRLAEGKKS